MMLVIYSPAGMSLVKRITNVCTSQLHLLLTSEVKLHTLFVDATN
jgi:hypothetical protein